MATVSKRGKYWRAQIRRLGFPPQHKTFDTHAEAEAWARVVECEMDRGIFSSRVEAERTTLAAALERYKNEISSRKAHPAQESQRISRWLRQPLAHRYLASLRGADFAQYRDMRRADGREENTIRLEMALVSHLFEIARKKWGMESLLHPLNNIRKPSGSRERDRRLRDGEYSLIADALDHSGNTMRTPGLRPGHRNLAAAGHVAAAALGVGRPCAPDHRNPFVVSAARQRGRAGCTAVVAACRRSAEVTSGPGDRTGVAHDGQRVALRLEACSEGTGHKDLRWHDLRHEAASRFFEKGLHPLELASITGYKSLTMLRRYTHLQPDIEVAQQRV